MTSKKTIYPGILGKHRKYNEYFMPNYVPSKSQAGKEQKENTNILSHLLEDFISSTNEKELNTDYEMLESLLKHYRISPTAEDKWMRLSFNLALDNVPCFSYEKARRGCPRKWTVEKNATLVAEVKGYLKKHPDHSAKDACRLLAKRNTFQVKNYNSLYARYMEAKKH